MGYVYKSFSLLLHLKTHFAAMTIRIIPFLIFYIASRLVFAQDFLSWKMNDRYFSAQAGLGFATYFGELQHTGKVQSEVSNLSLGLEARILPKIAVRAELGRYSIRGNDTHAADSSYEKQRNLSFESTNWELSLQGIFFMRKYRGVYHKRWQVDPYLLTGVGTTFISPKTTFSEQEIRLYQIETEGVDYSRFTMIVPVGAGLKFRVNPFLNFITEITYRFTFSDYLDDVSSNYPGSYPDITTELLSNRKNEIPVINEDAYDNLLIPGGPRGDNSDKDAYLFLNFKIEFFLPPDFLRKQ